MQSPFQEDAVYKHLGSLASLTARRFISRKTYDYVFFGEHHGHTPVALLLAAIRTYAISRVALEGLPRGRVTPAQLEELYEGQREKDRKHNATHIDLWNYANLRSMNPLRKGMLAKRAPAQLVDSLINKMDTLLTELIDIASMRDKIDGTGTIRYIPALAKREIEIFGIEDMEQYTSANKEYTQIISPNRIYYAFEEIGNIVNALRSCDPSLASPADTAFATCLKMQEWGVKKGFIQPNALPDKDYLIKAKNTLELKMNEERTETWMNYLQAHTPLLVVMGYAHVAWAEDFAQQQGKTHAVAYKAT